MLNSLESFKYSGCVPRKTCALLTRDTDRLPSLFVIYISARMPSNPDIGARCEFRTWHSVPKKDGTIQPRKVTDPFGDVDIGDDDSSYALVLRRVYSEKLELTEISLKVNSPHILRVFRDVIKSYTTVPSDFTKPFELAGPFQMLLHFWDELLDYRTATDDNHIRQHLNLLFDFMEHECGPDRDKILMMVAKNQITYLSAWAIYRPGDLLYTTILGEPWLLRCQKTAYEVSTSIGPYIDVHCTYTDHDGTLAGEAAHVVRIVQKRKFGSENPAYITDLAIYPRRYYKGDRNGEDLETRLEARGRKYLSLKHMSVQAYDGLAQYLKEPPYTYYHPDMEDFDGVWLPFTVR